MSTTDEREPDQIVRRYQVLGFLLLVGLVVGSAMLIHWRTFSAGKALSLGGEIGFWGNILLFGCAKLLGVVICVFGFWLTAYRLIRHRRFSAAHFSGAALVAVTLLYRGDFYMAGVRSRLGAIDESGYLSFAQQARDFVRGDKHQSVDLGILSFSGVTADRAKAEAFLKILKGGSLAVWPERFSHVTVDVESVSLSRGSGMTGTIEITVFDQRAESMLPPAQDQHVSANDSSEYHIYPRVVFSIRD